MDCVTTLPQYAVFGDLDQGEAGGGWKDHVGSYETLQEALDFADDYMEDCGDEGWCHVVDLMNKVIVQEY